MAITIGGYTMGTHWGTQNKPKDYNSFGKSVVDKNAVKGKVGSTDWGNRMNKLSSNSKNTGKTLGNLGDQINHAREMLTGTSKGTTTKSKDKSENTSKSTTASKGGVKSVRKTTKKTTKKPTKNDTTEETPQETQENLLEQAKESNTVCEYPEYDETGLQLLVMLEDKAVKLENIKDKLTSYLAWVSKADAILTILYKYTSNPKSGIDLLMSKVEIMGGEKPSQDSEDRLADPLVAETDYADDDSKRGWTIKRAKREIEIWQEQIVQFQKEALEWIKQKIKEITDFVNRIIEEIKKIPQRLLQAAINAIIEATPMGAAKKEIKDNQETIQTDAELTGAAIKVAQLANDDVQLTKKTVTQTLAVAKKASDVMVSMRAFLKTVEQVMSNLDNIKKEQIDKIKAKYESAKAKANKAYNDVKSAGKQLYGEAKDAGQAYINNVKTKANDVVAGVKKKANSAWMSARKPYDAARGIVSDAKTAIEGGFKK